MAKMKTSTQKNSPKEQPRTKRSKIQSPHAPGPDHIQRLLGRFYEPLVLLCALGRTRGDHETDDTPSSADVSNLPLKRVRRLFLRHLAYLCDYDKGGDTVTALGIEWTPPKKVFHVAANTSPASKIRPFLADLLLRLKAFCNTNSLDEESSAQLTFHCIRFAGPKIKAYISLIRGTIKGCRRASEQGALEQNTFEALLTWLDAFDFENQEHYELCRAAYDSRHCNEMRLLRQLNSTPEGALSTASAQIPVRMLRHYIGRLGQHFKVVQSLLLCLPRVVHLLDDFEVRTVSTPARMTPPPVNGKTNLDSILVRMLPRGSDRLVQYQANLAEMDSRFDIHVRLLEIYKDPNFRPRVHAEVQLLEVFHRKNLQFEDSDRFIACSKPACYCCSLYFRHHPLHPVMPPSHQTISRNWRPPDSMSYHKEEQNVLNTMAKDMREEAFRQIEAKRPRHPWHPDSTTGITYSDIHLHVTGDQDSQTDEHDTMETEDSVSLSSGNSLDDDCIAGGMRSPIESEELQFSDFPEEYEHLYEQEES